MNETRVLLTVANVDRRKAAKLQKRRKTTAPPAQEVFELQQPNNGILI